MPSSNYGQIPTVIELMRLRKPRTMIDLGFGYGKYGMLAREYLPGLELIDGVEVFANYIGDMQAVTYDTIYLDNILSFKAERRYDLALMVDVLEHFDVADGYTALERVLGYADRILVATPIEPAPQGAEHGNKHEQHLSAWSMAMLRERFKFAPALADQDINLIGLVYKR